MVKSVQKANVKLVLYISYIVF